MSWEIGNIKLKSRAVLAPMAGYTDLPFRRLARSYGAELTYTEMISSEAFVRNGKKTLNLLKTDSEDFPTGVQIVGSKPLVMSEAAKKLEDMGFILIDINMGCPARKIIKQGAGSGLLRDEIQFSKLIRTVISAVRIPVTIKLRTGLSDHDEELFVRFLKTAEQEGVSAITVHGRTQKQLYKGAVDLSPIRLAKETVRCPVIGNGDITTGAKAAHMIQETGCDAVMIGRGSLGNPWVFNEINACLKGKKIPPKPDLSKEAEALTWQMSQMVDFYGEKIGVLHMRKMGGFYFKNFPHAANFRKRIVRVSTKKEFIEAVEDYKNGFLLSNG